MKRCPKDSLLNAFYLKPLQKFKGKTECLIFYCAVVTGHQSDALQGYKRETEEQLLKVSKIVQGQKEKESTVKGNCNSALTSALEIPSSSGTLVLNICGGNCNITINNH